MGMVWPGLPTAFSKAENAFPALLVQYKVAGLLQDASENGMAHPRLDRHHEKAGRCQP